MHKEVKYRSIKEIDRDSFKPDILSNPLANPEDFDDVSTLVNIYNNVLSDLLDKPC